MYVFRKLIELCLHLTVAHEAEVENAAVLDGHHPTGQCQEVEVDQLPHQGEEDLGQALVRINTR